MRKKGSSIVAGILLLVIGGFLLADQLNPGLLDNILPDTFTWPWYVIGTGLLFIFFALLTGTGGLAVPGAVIGTIGLILNYQNTTGDWASWAFMWVLIPAGVGLGIILMALIDGDLHSAGPGFWMLTIGIIVFSILWAIFRQDSTFIATYWPILLILMGVAILIQTFVSKPRNEA